MSGRCQSSSSTPSAAEDLPRTARPHTAYLWCIAMTVCCCYPLAAFYLCAFRVIPFPRSRSIGINSS